MHTHWSGRLCAFLLIVQKVFRATAARNNLVLCAPQLKGHGFSAHLPAQYARKPRQNTTATRVNETMTTTKQYLSLPLQMYSRPPPDEGQQSDGLPQQQLGALLGFSMAL